MGLDLDRGSAGCARVAVGSDGRRGVGVSFRRRRPLDTGGCTAGDTGRCVFDPADCAAIIGNSFRTTGARRRMLHWLYWLYWLFFCVYPAAASSGSGRPLACFAAAHLSAEPLVGRDHAAAPPSCGCAMLLGPLGCWRRAPPGWPAPRRDWPDAAALCRAAAFPEKFMAKKVL
jgi:hypothetical protein